MAARGGNHRVVLNRFSDRLRERSLELKIPPDLPLIPFDTLLMEQVLSICGERPAAYPAGAPLEIIVTPQKSAVMIAIADRGPAYPARKKRLFSENSSAVQRLRWERESASLSAAPLSSPRRSHLGGKPAWRRRHIHVRHTIEGHRLP